MIGLSNLIVRSPVWLNLETLAFRGLISRSNPEIFCSSLHTIFYVRCQEYIRLPLQSNSRVGTLLTSSVAGSSTSSVEFYAGSGSI